tara:strand:- start:27945 stop:28628 length:684 start_codon:yes stop_codon:yes gene_type:complete
MRKRAETEDLEVAEERLSARALAQGDPIGWFDRLYLLGAEGRTTVPWSRTDPHPLLVRWARQTSSPHAGRAVVAGCALGADAVFCARLGCDTVGFDVSATAIGMAGKRLLQPDAVEFVVEDLLALPREWRQSYSLVVSIIMIQALPPSLRGRVQKALAALVAPGGTLLVIEAVADPGLEPHATGPWPLSASDLLAFLDLGLQSAHIELVPGEDLAGARWVAEFRRPF